MKELLGILLAVLILILIALPFLPTQEKGEPIIIESTPIESNVPIGTRVLFIEEPQ